MSTTAPPPDTPSPTTALELRSFEEPISRLVHPEGENGANGASGMSTASLDPGALTEASTTKQALDWVGVVRHRYTGAWPRQKRARFILKQEWIGRVDQVLDETFLVTLVTRSAPDEIEQAEIEMDEVAPADRGDLRPGAIFYWVLGYRDEAYGQRLGVSSIIFRRMIEPHPDQIQNAQSEAERALAFLDRANPAPANPQP